MRPFDPIHGIDYLVDYYAILSIDRNTSPEQIVSAYKMKILQYHPDLYARAAPEIKRQVQEKSVMILRAHEILSDPGKKAAYDEALRTFDPNLISATGEAIYDPRSRRKKVDVDFLVGGAKWHQKEEVFKLIGSMSGYNENVFGLIEQQFKSAEVPSPELREAYKQALRTKKTYLSLLEEVAWDEAGILNQGKIKGIHYAQEYGNKARELVEKSRADIVQGIEARVLSLSSGVGFQALTEGDYTYDAHTAREHSVELRKRLEEVALRSFEVQVPKIEDLAQQKAQVLEELVELTDWEYFPPNQDAHNKLLLFVPWQGKVFTAISYQFEGQKVTVQDYNEFIGMDFESFKSEQNSRLQDLIKSGINVAILYFNPDIDFTLEMGFIANQHLKKISNNSSLNKK